MEIVDRIFRLTRKLNGKDPLEKSQILSKTFSSSRKGFTEKELFKAPDAHFRENNYDVSGLFEPTGLQTGEVFMNYSGRCIMVGKDNFATGENYCIIAGYKNRATSSDSAYSLTSNSAYNLTSDSAYHRRSNSGYW